MQTHFPESEEMLKGHGRKIISGLRSTKKASPTVEDDTPSRVEDVDVEESNSNRPTTKQKEIFVGTCDLQDEMQRKMCTDQTGKFPQKSSRGNQYIMVLIDMDSDAILVEAMKNRKSGEMV